MVQGVWEEWDAAACRELHEETGIHLDTRDLTELNPACSRMLQHKGKFHWLKFFIARWNGEQISANQEFESLGWQDVGVNQLNDFQITTGWNWHLHWLMWELKCTGRMLKLIWNHTGGPTTLDCAFQWRRLRHKLMYVTAK